VRAGRVYVTIGKWWQQGFPNWRACRQLHRAAQSSSTNPRVTEGMTTIPAVGRWGSWARVRLHKRRDDASAMRWKPAAPGGSRGETAGRLARCRRHDDAVPEARADLDLSLLGLERGNAQVSSRAVQKKKRVATKNSRNVPS